MTTPQIISTTALDRVASTIPFRLYSSLSQLDTISHQSIRFIHIEEGSGKELGQTSESGRDQGHATLDYALLSVIAQTAWNQGLDLFGYSNSRILAG